MHKAIFLDRDGVINQTYIFDSKPYPPKNINELIILPKTAESLLKLSKAGYKLIIVTNQPDVARGIINKKEVDDIHHYLLLTLQLDAIFTCFHDDDQKCKCRKPLPGLIVNAARIYNIDLKQSYVIGDRWKDIEAGHQAGCVTFFIDYQYNERKPAYSTTLVNSLQEAAHIILNGKFA
ncbi:MAG: HAD family hydrolase [Pseudomonadota bacterium]